MNKVLALLMSLILVTDCSAQSTVAKRNDGAATTLQGNNLGNIPLATDSKGQSFVTTNGTPIPVSFSVSGTPQPISGNVTVVNTSQTPVPVTYSGTPQPVNISVASQTPVPENLAQIKGVAVSVGNGTVDTGVQRFTLSSDSTGQLICNAGTNLNTSALATSANQSTEITSLASIDTKTPSLGQALMAASSPVVIASNQSAVPVSGTFYQATQPISIASGQVASGAYAAGSHASGSYASGALASGSIASGALAAGSIALGAAVLGSIVDGAVVTLGAKADNRSSSTDTTAITVVQILKQLSFMLQNPAALPSNQSVNVAQLAGTTTDTNSGNKSAGTLRTVLATDQPNLTTPLNINTAQINGVAPSMGNGGTGTGVLRVAQVNDGTGVLTSIGSITSAIVPGTAATNLGKAEDVGSSGGDTGVAMYGIRNDALASNVGSDADYGPFGIDKANRILMIPYAPPEAKVRGCASASNTADTSVVAASGSASLKTYIVACQISNTGTVDTLVTLKDGSGGATLGTTPASGNFGGSNITFPIEIVTTANTALYFASGNTTNALYVCCQGYKAP